MGLSDTSGTSTLVLPDAANFGHGTILVDGIRSAGNASLRDDTPPQRKVDISTARLDDLLPFLSALRAPGAPFVLKMDVEGFELRALRGMSRVLQLYDVRYMFMELRFLLERGNGMQHGADILAFLLGHGYAPLRLRDTPTEKLNVEAPALTMAKIFTTRWWDWSDGNNVIFRKVGVRLYHHPLMKPKQRR